MPMKDEDVRKLVVDALQKVLTALNKSETVMRLKESKVDVAIADLGIDSLDAVEWCMEIETRSGVELDPVELTTHRSIDALVGLIVDRRRHVVATPATSPPLVRVSRDGPLPLSFAQESIWTYCQTSERPPTYALGLRDHILGPLDVEVLRDCLSEIVRRHEILRTTYALRDGQPVQVIHPAEPVALPVFDFGGESEPDEALARIVRAESFRVADLIVGPLARFSLVRCSENEHWLLRVCHHILWDAWSSKIIFDEFALLYSARIEGAADQILEPDPLQVADYAAWQRKNFRPDGPLYQDTIAWWKTQFEQWQPMPDLPFKRPAPLANVDCSEGRIAWPVEAELVKRLNRLIQQEYATPYAVWLAALVALLAAETGQPEIVVGSYVANRRREVQNTIGFFINLATLSFRVDDASSFRDWLSKVRIRTTEVEARCEIPQETLRQELQRLNVTLPNVSVIFGAPMGRNSATIEFAGLKMTRQYNPVDISMPWGFSMNLLEADDQQSLGISFDAEIYDPAGVRRFVARLHDLLDAISYRPDLPIGELLARRDVEPV
jgi:acyl carrier protein